MSSPTNASLLTPLIEIQTKVPFVAAALDGSDKNPKRVLNKVDSETIHLKICSEFVEHAAPVNAFDGKEKLGLVADKTGQPIVLSLGTDEHLYCLLHVDGGPVGWQLFDISPGDTVSAFDIIKDAQQIIHVAAAVPQHDGTSVVYHASYAVPSLSYDSTTRFVTGFDPKTSISWKAIPNNIGGKNVSYLQCGLSGAPFTKSANFQITAGTIAQANIDASHYTIDPSPENQAPWKNVTLPETADTIIEIQPASSNDGNGLYTLYKRVDQTIGCTADILDPQTSARLFSFRMLLSNIGTTRSIFANMNPWSKTDLFAAGEKGIGFFDFKKPDKPPMVVLPEVSFKQVVCSEAPDGTSDATLKTQSKLAIFGISDHDELYFIEGTRLYKGNQMSFAYSGLPIRTGVERISSQYNSKKDSSEVIYISNGINEVVHLSRDPTTSVWNENKLAVLSPSKIIKTPSYISTITLTDSKGHPVPEGYPLTFTSEPLLLTANDRSYAFDSRPTVIPTDRSGQVCIVIPVHDLLTAPVFELTLNFLTDAPENYDVHPAQRVMRLMGKVNSADDLANAKTTTGRPALGKIPRGNLETAANLLANFPSMVGSVNPAAAKDILQQTSSAANNLSVSWEKDADGNVKKSSGNWLTDAVSNVVHALGDMLEFLKKAFKAVVKVAIKIVGPVISFVINIAGKVIVAVIKSIGPLVRCVANFLRDHLGIDITGFLDWLGFLFDMEKTKKTQKVLTDFANNLMGTTEKFFEVNRSTLTDGIDAIADKIRPTIEDSRPPPDQSTSQSGVSLPPALGWLFNNPVLGMIMKYNPLTWLFEAIDEELGDSFKLPSLEPLTSILTDIVPKLLEKEFDNLWRLFEDLQLKLANIARNTSKIGTEIFALIKDAFWTFWDAVKYVIIAAFDTIFAIVKEIFEIAKGTWKIPIFSGLYEDFTDQEFSLLNVSTLCIAGIMNLFYLTKEDKMPFDVLGDPNAMFTMLDRVDLDLHGILGIAKSEPKVAQANIARPQGMKLMSAMESIPSTQTNTMFDGNIVLVTASTTDGDKSPEGGEEKTEHVGDYDLYAFELGQEVCSLIGAMLRSASSILETDAAIRDEQTGPRWKALDIREWLYAIIQVFCSGANFLTRFAGTLHLAIASTYDSVGKEVKEHRGEYVAGSIFTLLFSLSAVVLESLGVVNKWGMSRKLGVAGNVTNTVAVLTEVILLHFALKQEEWQEETVNSLELIASVCGIAGTLTAVFARNPYGKAAAAILAGTDGVTTAVASGFDCYIIDELRKKRDEVAKHD